MRRIVAIFKRSDKFDASSSQDSELSQPASPTVKTPRFFRSLSSRALPKEPPQNLSPIPPVPSLPQASSSSSSSTDSPSPSTPVDEPASIHPGQKRPSLPWLASRTPVVLTENSASYTWAPPSAFQASKPYPPTATPVDDSEYESSSATSSSPSETPASLPIARSDNPRAVVHSLTTNALVSTFSAPPLLHVPGSPLFPRSCNLISSLPHKQSTESTLHRTRLIHRLEGGRRLTRSEELSIAAFASRKVAPRKRAPSLRLDDNAVKDPKRISMASHGLKIWVSRPCFEDRMIVYTPAPLGSSHAFNESRISGSAFGVAALESSSGLEALAGLTMEEALDEICPPSATSSSSSLPLSSGQYPPPPAPSRNQPYKPNPSPLRLEATSSPPQKFTSPENGLLTSNVQTSDKRRVRNSVRFELEEDKKDKEDLIPLGQIMRIKRGRAEKAKFLELERERRAIEEERIRHEMERKKWQKEKQGWEDQKRAIEEEKRKHQYAQEVVASRKRRESFYRYGSSLNPDDPEVLPKSPTTYSRAEYDPQRRHASEPAPDIYCSRDQSPESSQGTSRTRVDSRPPSIHSRPASLQSSHTFSSAEDLRYKDARGRSNKRGSLLSESPRNSLLPQQMVPYGWSAIPPVPQLPPMPYYNYNMDNMPLLPPTPPFMMQQHGNGRRSQNSSSSSRKSETKPTGHSTERPSRPESLRQKNTHLRHSSGDIVSSKRLSVASRTPSTPAISGLNDRVPHSRPGPFPAPVQSYGYPTLPRVSRRQTAIT